MEPTLLFKHMNAMDRSLLNGDKRDDAALVCSLEMKTKHLADPTRVWEELAAYVGNDGGAVGWLCRQSDVVRYRAADPPQPAPVQYGEITRDAKNGLLIRPDGAGGLRLVFMTEREGDALLGVVQRHVGRRRAPDGGAAVGALRYRVYWQREDGPAGGYRNVAARFLGFEAAEVKP